jgi:hypothetical protein
MGGTPRLRGRNKLQNVDELLGALRCQTLDDLSELVDAESSFAGGVALEEADQLIIRIDQYGVSCEFPVTLDEFWEHFEALEADVFTYVSDRG